MCNSLPLLTYAELGWLFFSLPIGCHREHYCVLGLIWGNYCLQRTLKNIDYNFFHCTDHMFFLPLSILIYFLPPHYSPSEQILSDYLFNISFSSSLSSFTSAVMGAFTILLVSWVISLISFQDVSKFAGYFLHIDLYSCSAISLHKTVQAFINLCHWNFFRSLWVLPFISH